jgi:hypothetical protein
MGFKRKPMLTRQMADVEKSLQIRLTYLAGKGIEGPKTDKDPLVRKLQADIRTLKNRLRAIAASEKITEDAVKSRADKAAAALKENEPAAGKAEKPKKGAEEAKEKKAKPEKKAASDKTPEEGKKKKVSKASSEEK